MRGFGHRSTPLTMQTAIVRGDGGGAAPNTHTSTTRGCLWMAVGHQNRGPPLYVGVCGWLVSTITADLHYLWVFVDGFWSEGLETI